MVLATAGEDGRPSSRTVLCKGLDARGIVFYTNYTSAKSHQLRATRYASATFPWYAQHRQVHVRGHVELVTPEENAAYWATRPRGSQLGAWASAQSVEVRDRRVLDDALEAITQRFAAEEEVPAPPHLAHPPPGPLTPSTRDAGLARADAGLAVGLAPRHGESRVRRGRVSR